MSANIILVVDLPAFKFSCSSLLPSPAFRDSCCLLGPLHRRAERLRTCLWSNARLKSKVSLVDGARVEWEERESLWETGWGGGWGVGVGDWGEGESRSQQTSKPSPCPCKSVPLFYMFCLNINDAIFIEITFTLYTHSNEHILALTFLLYIFFTFQYLGERP